MNATLTPTREPRWSFRNGPRIRKAFEQRITTAPLRSTAVAAMSTQTRRLIRFAPAVVLLIGCNNTIGRATDETKEQVELIAQDTAFDVAIPNFTAGATNAMPATEGGTWNHGGSVFKRWKPDDADSSAIEGAIHLVDAMTAGGWTVIQIWCDPLSASLRKDLDGPVGLGRDVDASVIVTDGEPLPEGEIVLAVHDSAAAEIAEPHVEQCGG